MRPADMPMRAESTLQIRWPLGQSLGLALLLLSGFLAICEALARSGLAKAHLPVPSVGSASRQFEIQLARLESRVERQGSVDCIFLGSSMVLRGFNPSAFEASFQAATGRPARCQNFGVRGMNARTAGRVAQVLAPMYHPKLVLYGTHFHDLADTLGYKIEPAVADIPWLNYRLGASNFDGWLIDHSMAYRRYLWLVGFIRAREEAKWASTQIDGFNPRPEKERAVKLKLPMTFEMSERQVAGLRQVLALKDQGIDVLIVEMPLRPALLDTLKNAGADRDTFVTRLSQWVGGSQGEVIFTQQLHLIPEEGWYNDTHMNLTGAEVFSRWLGEQVGRAANRRWVPAGAR